MGCTVDSDSRACDVAVASGVRDQCGLAVDKLDLRRVSCRRDALRLSPGRRMGLGKTLRFSGCVYPGRNRLAVAPGKGGHTRFDAFGGGFDGRIAGMV